MIAKLILLLLGALLACLAVMALLCRVVFMKAIGQLRQRRCTVELLAESACIVSALEGVMCLLPLARTEVTPYAPAALLTMVAAQQNNWRPSGKYRQPSRKYHCPYPSHACPSGSPGRGRQAYGRQPGDVPTS